MYRLSRIAPLALAGAVALGACAPLDRTTGERTATGAAVGAAGGATVGLFGGNPLGGALRGAVAGAAGGLVYDQINKNR